MTWSPISNTGTVVVTVESVNDAPVIRITDPARDLYADVNETIPFQLVASDVDNAITNVRLLADGEYVGDATHVNSNTYTVPYITPDHTTSNALQAVAYDADGLASTSQVVVVRTTPLRSPENPLDTVPGLSYSYYEGDWERLPDFDRLIPASTGFVSSPDVRTKEAR